MALLGKAAVAMWWTIRPEQQAEFGDWHSHEHFPERLGIAGFRRGSRWTSERGDGGFFVLYELEAYETLTSKGYLDRLNAPTPWSKKMMPHHLDMVRSQCRVVASFGGGVAGALATLRLSPDNAEATGFQDVLTGVLGELAPRPGLTGAHLLVTDTPRTAALTTEQQIRGADGVADWIVLLSGYDAGAVETAMAGPLSPSALRGMGALETPIDGRYRLAFTMTANDVTAGTP